MPRKPYPTDVSDEEWSFAAPYLSLMDQRAPQREHDLREVFNALRWLVRAGAPWRMLPNDLPPWEAVYQQTRRWLEAGCFEAMVSDLRSIIRVAQGRQGQPSAMVMDGRTLQSSCESGPRAGYDGYKRKRGSKVHMAVDTLGHLLAVHVTPANEQERAQVQRLCGDVQQATGHSVKLGWADQGLYGRGGSRGCKGQRHRSADREAARSEKGLRAAAPALGGRAQLRVAGEIPQTHAGLRAPTRSARRAAFPGLCRAHVACSRTGAGCGGKFITRSNLWTGFVKSLKFVSRTAAALGVICLPMYSHAGGALETMTLDGNQFRASGWACDSTRPDEATGIHIWQREVG